MSAEAWLREFLAALDPLGPRTTPTRLLLAAVLVGVAALLVGLALVPLAMRAAWRRGWVAKPRADRWHTRPTALMGGIAIFAAATLTLMLTGQFADLTLVAQWIGASGMFVLGAIDDRRSVMPRPKLVTQVACTALATAVGLRAFPAVPVWVSFPLTAVWVVGITNALNLLDNMDGLAAGIAAIVCGALGVYFAVSGDHAGMVVAMATGGATLAFLRYNYRPARVFMGDCGSLFLGYTIALLALRAHGDALEASASTVGALLPLVLLAVPIADTTLVTVSRLRNGRPVAQGGRDHSSHRLVYLGLSEEHAVLTLYACAGLCGVVTLAAHWLTSAAWMLSAASVAAVVVLLFVRLYHVPAYERVPVAAPLRLPRDPAAGVASIGGASIGVASISVPSILVPSAITEQLPPARAAAPRHAERTVGMRPPHPTPMAQIAGLEAGNGPHERSVARER